MARRPQPTFADYIVIALSPALIMLLVGSLVFFLIEVFYRGDYDGRLTFIMAMFVAATVLIARISIEQSREYAALFALPLAIVTVIALQRFVEFGGPLRSFSIFINIGLMALVWWCSDKLTWDSTVIDESKDASGEGLLQTAGLDADATTQNAAAAAAAERQQPQLNPWQRFLAYRRRPHSPGVWVIYFSIAALPIFGFGHWFVPASDLESRRYVFKLLVTYVAAGLGLLLTTSFLNLRRYLRQRRLEMPLEMAGAWIGTGAAMIVALLALCMLLPRRNPEYSVTQLPIFAGSPTDLWTTEWAVGNEGQEDPENADRMGEQSSDTGQSPDGEKSDSDNPFGDPDSKNESPKSPATADGKQGSTNANQDGQNQQKDVRGAQKQPSNQPSDQPNESQSQSDSKQSQSQSDSKSNASGEKQDQKSPIKKPGDNQGESEKSKSPNAKDSPKKSPQKSPDQTSKGQDQSQASSDQSSEDKNTKKQSDQKKASSGSGSKRNRSAPQPQKKFDVSKIGSAIGGSIGQLLKFLYWAIALAIIAYFLWKYWRQVCEAVANFWKSLQEFWASLMGRKPVAAEEEILAAPVVAPPKHFAAYSDPFLTGAAHSRPPVEVIRYSFEAFEAWAREHGFPHQREQTPQEFAQQVGAEHPAMAREVAALAELYNRCAYGRDLGARVTIEPLRRLWEQMRDRAPRPEPVER